MNTTHDFNPDRPDPLATTAASAAADAPAGFPPMAGRCRINGEIAAAAWASSSRDRPSSAGRWPSRSCWPRADERPDLARRFLEEARLAGRLQHPGIVRRSTTWAACPTAGPTSP